MKVLLQRLENCPYYLPEYQTDGSAGMDLHAALNCQGVMINPREHAIVPCGFAIALPEGFEAQIRSRSGLAAKHGIFVLNSPGTVDSDYRGEIKVVLANFSNTPYRVCAGYRIAQMVIAPVTRIEWEETNILPDTVRGSGGMGSTGGFNG